MKIKITLEQYNKLLSESSDVKGGLNRINRSFSSSIKGNSVQNLSEEPFNIKSPVSGIPNSAMKKTPERKLNEDESNNISDAIFNLIRGIWENPMNQEVGDTFNKLGLTWDQLIEYLVSKNIITNVDDKGLRVKNFFRTRYSKNIETGKREKLQDIHKLSKILEKDKDAPWTNVDEIANIQNNTFNVLVIGSELAVLQGSDSLYVFDLDKITNEGQELTSDSISRYINANFNEIDKGDGLKAFNSGSELVKIDDELRDELIQLYSKDKKFISALTKIDEMTSAGSAGAFTGPLTGQNVVKRTLNPVEEVVEVGEEDETIEETTTTVPNSPSSSSTGAYVQPKIWAKDKANWAANKKTQYPHGEMVSFDPCTKLNNNKSAQRGGCSQGAANNVVKTHKTKQSVISKTVYEEIAEKTGRSVLDVMKVIETKLNKKHL